MAFDIATKGPNETPGIASFAWIAKHSDFLVIAGLPASPSTQAQKVTIADNHTFTPPKGFEKMYIDVDNSMLEGAGFGTKDNKGATMRLNAFFPGTKVEFAAFLKDNPELIVLVPDGNCDGVPRYQQIGTKCSPAKIVAEWAYNSATAGSTDNRGFEFQIECHQGSLLFYTGTVTEAGE